MTVLERTDRRLVLGERSFGSSRHWGFLMLVLATAASLAINATGKPLPPPVIGVLALFFAAGLFAAVFMKARLTHILDKDADELRIEHPARFDTRVEVERTPLSQVRAVVTSRQSFLHAALTRGDSIRCEPGLGFAYVLEDGRRLEAGLYSTAQDEIEAAAAEAAAFLGLDKS